MESWGSITLNFPGIEDFLFLLERTDFFPVFWDGEIFNAIGLEKKEKTLGVGGSGGSEQIVTGRRIILWACLFAGGGDRSGDLGVGARTWQMVEMEPCSDRFAWREMLDKPSGEAVCGRPS